jgi:carboxymethylenebutenolidase
MATPQPDGYFALPADVTGAGVLVLHAWWGLNDTIKAFCDRLAGEGFVTFAADLYHGEVARTIPEAEALGGTLDGNFQQARAEIVEAARFVDERSANPGSGIAVIAFSLGVYYALDLAGTHPELVDAAVIFYGAGDGDYSNSRASYMGHFAENDPYEPRENADNLEASLRSLGRPVSFYHYPNTGHWFFEPDRVDEYDPAAATLAWKRTLAFLRSTAAA